ncbi:MAG: hypothetical protein K2K18_01960 [Malacoplasma sp.]|nr:hypothetical protein [Malacoplasma sp.]
MNKKRLKKFLPLVLSLGTITVVPTVLASCSAQVSSTLLDNLVSKGNGLQLTNNLNLSDLAKYSLTTSTGSKKWHNQLNNQAIYQWYLKLATNNDLSNNKDGYNRLWETQKNKINDDYNNAYDSSKNSNGNDFLLKFQQDELDVNGGNEDAWKKQKWLEWASSTFASDLFTNFYLSLVDKNDNFVPATKANLENALTESSDITFKFNKNGTNNSKIDNYVANEYANFQQFIYDQWVQSENPFVISYSQWNYSNPVDGLDSIYNPNAIGKDAVNQTVSANYKFPYFSSSKTNDSYSDVEKFNNFKNSARNGFFENDAAAESIGLINMNKYGFSADTSSSYKLINNVNTYTSNSSNLSLASTFLFSTAYSNDKKVNNDIRKKISKPFNDSSGLPFDSITSNFVSVDKESFKNKDLSGTSDSSSETTYVPYTQIQDNQVKQILSSNAYSQLASTTSSGSDSSSIKYDTNNGLYVIDAFIATDNSDLSNVIFLRDDAAVYAIALDGEIYISKASNLIEAKKRAGDIVLYRYLQNKSNANTGFSIDLQQTLKTFFEENRDWLITKYAQLETNQSLFDFNFINGDKNALIVLQDLANYAYISSRYKRMENYETNLFETKNKYDVSDKSALASNYGTKSLFNGLAAMYPYPFTAAVKQETNKVGEIGHYTALDTLKLDNPFSVNDQSLKDIDLNDPYGERGVYKKLNSDINLYITSKSFGPLQSDFDGFKYSQYIYTNDFFINQAILAVGNDGNLLSDLIKKNVLLQSGLKEKFNLSSYDYIIPQLYDINNYQFNNNDVSSYINSALSNYFFNSNFQNSSSKWIDLKQTQSFDFNNSSTTTPPSTSSPSLPTVSYDVLNKYRKDLWIKENIEMNAIPADNYVNFLTLLSTIDYLMANDGQVFLSQLSSKLSTADTRLSFLVWETSIDTKNQKDTTNKKPNEVLYQKDNLYSNVNNSQGSAYYPLNSDYSVVDTLGSAFANDSYLSSYYTHVSDMINFQGIQTNSNFQNITKSLENNLFVNFPTDQKGLLYGFSDKRENLVNMVKNYSSSQVLALANNIQKLFDLDISNIVNASNLSQMQQNLISIINDNNKIKDDAFKPKQGYVNQDLYSEESDEISGYKYASYVIQLSENNLTSATGFLDYLETAFTTNDPNQTTSSTTNANSEKQANDLFWNLVVQMATDTSIQTSAISNVTSTNKVTVYDIRLNNQLGSRWVLNYKDQSS